jgi:hypothetical protein
MVNCEVWFFLASYWRLLEFVTTSKYMYMHLPLARHLSVSGVALPFAGIRLVCLSRQWDGYPLGLGLELVVEVR